jgi:hypothetical protein
MEHAQNASLQEALKQEFLQAHARGPILTRDYDFARKVGFSFTQKYPTALAYLRIMQPQPAPVMRVTAADVARLKRVQAEIESEAPT